MDNPRAVAQVNPDHCQQTVIHRQRHEPVGIGNQAVDEIEKRQKAAGDNGDKEKNKFPEEFARFPVVSENSDLLSYFVHNVIILAFF